MGRRQKPSRAPHQSRRNGQAPLCRDAHAGSRPLERAEGIRSSHPRPLLLLLRLRQASEISLLLRLRGPPSTALTVSHKQRMLVLAVACLLTTTAPAGAEDPQAPGGCLALASLLQAGGTSLNHMAAALIHAPEQEGGVMSLKQVWNSFEFAPVAPLAAGNSRHHAGGPAGDLGRGAAAGRPRHCRDLQHAGDVASGVRQVFPFRAAPDAVATVYCDQDTDGGGWTVFQRRRKGPAREDFYRTWLEYKLGFGHMDGGEFWLGLDLLHHLTSTELQELRVDLEDHEGGARWAKYGFFHVGDAAARYRLNVGRYKGNAGDGLAPPSHSGQVFSTHDRDNDSINRNCAIT
ncbi:FreD [Penaeus vannamei]|uniref:FreD n=1 Tax=Penaeus vannamei TaxID=6689 RepID=A0A3R7PUN6_PENVA|nr:FreD [Penaeus vannamei]